MNLRLPKANVEWRISDDFVRCGTEIAAIFTLPDGRCMANTAVIDKYTLDRAPEYGDRVVDRLLADLERSVGRALVRGDL